MGNSRKEDGRAHPFGPMRRMRREETLVALVVALFLHLLLILALPRNFAFLGPLAGTDETEEVELMLLTPEIPPEEMRFVEANPDAPENEPDNKRQYSFRAQQAADEAEGDDGDTPSVDGEEASHKIVQGAVEEVPPLPPGTYSSAARPGEGDGTEGGTAGAQMAMAPPPPVPPPAFLRQEPVDEDGPGSSPDLTGEADEVVAEPDPDAPLQVTRDPRTGEATQSGDGSGGSEEARPVPRARPRLSPDLIQGPLMRSLSSVSRRGTVAIDATFSEFGEYQQQFLAAVQAGWYREIEFHQPLDTAVRVRVRMNLKADGKVDDVEIVDSTASEIASLICKFAVEGRSPFRPWTREMVEVFGEERSLDIEFRYY